MHLDRSLRRLRLDPSMGIQELLARRPRPAPKQEINVVGGVLVYCDPKTWPENPEKLNLPEGWFVAVGVHRSILSLRRDLSRCIWESIASGIRTGDSLLTWLSSSLHPSATG
jgi:hypothetical protein